MQMENTVKCGTPRRSITGNKGAKQIDKIKLSCYNDFVDNFIHAGIMICRFYVAVQSCLPVIPGRWKMVCRTVMNGGKWCDYGNVFKQQGSSGRVQEYRKNPIFCRYGYSLWA